MSSSTTPISNMTTYNTYFPTIKVLDERVRVDLIKRGTSGSAGIDIPLLKLVDILPNNVFKFDTGITVEFPKPMPSDDFRWYGQLFPRSSMVKTPFMLKNGIGVIDHDYTGRLFVCLQYTNYVDQTDAIKEQLNEGLSKLGSTTMADMIGAISSISQNYKDLLTKGNVKQTSTISKLLLPFNTDDDGYITGQPPVIVQLIFAKDYCVTPKVVTHNGGVSQVDVIRDIRGDGGFGSTNTKEPELKKVDRFQDSICQ